jgi:hypothetical protein
MAKIKYHLGLHFKIAQKKKNPPAAEITAEKDASAESSVNIYQIGPISRHATLM